jgi:hypothetical protein
MVASAEVEVSFDVVWPCFAILTSTCKGFVVLREQHGNHSALLVLTSEERLTEYRQWHKLSGPTVRFENSLQFLAVLKSLPPHIGLVSFDASKIGPAVRVADLVRAIGKLPAGGDEGGGIPNVR